MARAFAELSVEEPNPLSERTDVREHMHFFVFGHAILEKAVQPYKGVTAKALLMRVARTFAELPLDANRDLGARFLDEGHEVANHTYTHPTFPSLDQAAMTSEVVRCRDAITRLTGSGGRF